MSSLPKAFADSPDFNSSAATATVEYAGDDLSDVDSTDVGEVAEQDPAAPIGDEAVADDPQEQTEATPQEDGEPGEVVEEPTETDAAKAEGDFTKEQIEDAIGYGYTEEEARAFGSAENLARSLAAHDRQLAALGRQLLEAQQGQQPVEEVAAEPAKKEAEAPKPAEQTVADTIAELEKFKLTLSPDDYDAATIQQFNGLNDHYHGAITKISADYQQRFAKQQETIDALRDVVLSNHEQFHQITSQTQAEAAAQFEEQMDSFFAGLGDEFKETFGKGGISALKADAPERAARIKLVEEMNVLQMADGLLAKQQGRRPKTLKELQASALRSLHGNTLKTSARKEILDANGKRNTQALARPAGRQMKARTGREAAIRRVESVLRQRGTASDDGDTEL